MTTLDYDPDYTHDAWVVGEHDLPDDQWEFPTLEEGDVAVYDHENDEWEFISQDEFDAEYQWLD